MEKMSKISENTLVPISLVLTIIGGVVWLSMMHSKVEAHDIKITKMRDFQQETVDRLARIETKLDMMIENKRGKL